MQRSNLNIEAIWQYLWARKNTVASCFLRLVLRFRSQGHLKVKFIQCHGHPWGQNGKVNMKWFCVHVCIDHGSTISSTGNMRGGTNPLRYHVIWQSSRKGRDLSMLSTTLTWEGLSCLFIPNDISEQNPFCYIANYLPKLPRWSKFLPTAFFRNCYNSKFFINFC